MQKQAWTWTTPRLPQPGRLVRWGHFGIPVLIFPTAGGDFEEIERFHLVAALTGLLESGKMKAYCVDGIGVRTWLSATKSQSDCRRAQDDYDSFLYEEVLHRIRTDCQDDRIEPMLVGASLGASVAVATLCRHPDSFRSAVGLSGAYKPEHTPVSPAAAVQNLSEPQLERLRHRKIILGSGEGEYENPIESRWMTDAFASKGIPCRLTLWGPTRDHTWSTWRDTLPPLLAELL